MAKKTTTKKSATGKASKARTQKTRAASTSKKRNTKATTAKKTRSTNKGSTKKQAAVNRTKSQGASLWGRLQTELHGLRGFHALSALVFAVMIGLVYVFMEVVERTVSVGYAASDALRGGDVLAPAIRDILTFDVRHGLAVLLGVALLYSLYVATRGWKTYLSKTQKGATAGRWFIAVILGVIGLELVAVLNGVYDITLIKMLAVLLAVAGFLAYRSDVSTVRKTKATFFIAAVLTASAVALALTTFIVFSMIYGAMLPIQLYLTIDILALALIAYAVNQLFFMKGKKGFATPELAERNYAAITTLGIVAFTAAVIFTFIA